MSLAEDWDSIPVQGQGPPKSLADDWDNTPVKTTKDTQSTEPSALSVLGGIGESNLKMVTGTLSQAGGAIAGSAVGTWNLVKNLANGMPFKDAYNQASQSGLDVAHDITEKGTYEPKSDIGKAADYLMQRPENPLTLPGRAINKVGETVSDVTGNPRLGQEATEAITAAPTIALGAKLFGSKLSLPSKDTTPARAAWEGAEVPRGAIAETKPSVFQAEKTGEVIKGEVKLPETFTDVDAPTPKGVQTGEVKLPETFTDADAPTAKGVTDVGDRGAVLDRIGLNTVRKSSLEGHALNAASDYQTTKFNEPAGEVAKAQFSAERNALESHSQKIVQQTGGSLGMDEEALQARGQSIAQPFDALRDYFKTASKQLYTEADARAAGAPLPLDSFNELINTKSAFAGKAENGSLGKGIKAYLREQSVMDKEGNLQPVTVKQAEGIKQYINSQWDPSTSGLAGKIKGAIDNDVMKNAGEDTYDAARSMYKQMKATLDDPKGISKMFETDPNTPINRAVPFEKIPDSVVRLPADQFKHIVDTLRGMPPELSAQSQSGMAEIKAQLANKLYDVGNKFQTQWNAPGVTKYLNDNKVKFNMVFSPQEMANIYDLQRAGNILRVDPSYPGAYAQAANSIKRGLGARAVQSASAWIGGAVGGGPGAAVGEAVGEKAAGKMRVNSGIKQFNKGLVNLKDATKK